MNHISTLAEGITQHLHQQGFHAYLRPALPSESWDQGYDGPYRSIKLDHDFEIDFWDEVFEVFHYRPSGRPKVNTLQDLQKLLQEDEEQRRYFSYNDPGCFDKLIRHLRLAFTALARPPHPSLP